MLTSTLLTTLSLLVLTSAQSDTVPVTGKLGNAPIAYNNPPATYTATLPDKETTSVRGTVTGTAASNGTGVVWTVNVSGLPSSGGPFLYHIHDYPVPQNGSCLATLAHLDPYQRGETPPCDKSAPQTCQVGDLAGKHGKITSDPFQTTYLDLYTQTAPGSRGFFGNRSVVVHFANKTRITCANFVLKEGGATTTGGYGVPTGPTGKASPSAYVNSASGVFASLSVLVGGLLVALL